VRDLKADLKPIAEVVRPMRVEVLDGVERRRRWSADECSATF
jgi:hypothetical protein